MFEFNPALVKMSLVLLRMFLDFKRRPDQANGKFLVKEESTRVNEQARAWSLVRERVS